MSSLLSYFPDASVAVFFRLVAILIVALVVNRLLRLITNLLIKPAASEARAAKAREQQTRTVAVVLYSAGSKIVWGVALLTAASEFRIRSEEHTSELQSHLNLVCRLLLEKKKKDNNMN